MQNQKQKEQIVQKIKKQNLNMKGDYNKVEKTN